MKGILTSAALIFFLGHVDALHCRQCTGAASLNDCTRTQLCAADEFCYTDKAVTDQLQIVYYAGCRAREICIHPHIVGKRGDLIACSRCCDTDERNGCNSRLCGFNSSTTKTMTTTAATTSPTAAATAAASKTDALHCRQCTGAVTLDDCTRTQLCAADEICYTNQIVTDALAVVYDAGCTQKKVCTFGSGGGGSTTGLVACSTCCDIDEPNGCNSRLCGIKSNGHPRRLQCRGCTRASALSNCTHTEYCSQDEVCFMDKVVTDTGTVEYYGGCRQEYVCRSLSTVGKRTAPLMNCSQCCSSAINCNSQLCGIH